MLTPEEIFEKEFKRSMRGYDVNEVNEFLDQIIQDLFVLQEENKNLKKELKKFKTGSSRTTFHNPTNQENISIEDLSKRVEILEKKTKFL